MSRLIYEDRDALRLWKRRRLWKEWTPFIIVAVLSLGLLVVIAITAPVFRPLPIPGSSSPPSGIDRLSELVGFARDSVGQQEIDAAEAEALAGDST